MIAPNSELTGTVEWPKEARPVDDPRALIAFGWAPGGYQGRCGKCGEMHSGSDKRSPCCQDCAESAFRLAAPSAAEGGASIPGETEAGGGSDILDVLAKMQAEMAQVFDKQRAEWARESPAVMARAESLGIAFDSMGGNCPVQAEGSFDGERFYFRARGDEWSLNVWTGTDDYETAANPDEWWIEREYGSGYEAGWMPLHKAIGFICDGVEEYRALAILKAKATDTGVGG